MINEAIREEVDALVESRQKIMLFGCGTFAACLLTETRLKEASIIAVADNDPVKRGSDFFGFPVIGVSEIPTMKPGRVVITVGRYDLSIWRQLESLEGSFVIDSLPQYTVYFNRLAPVMYPMPILADYPHFVAPVEGENRFTAPALIRDSAATLSVKVWRYSYNCRGIVELENDLDGSKTAVVVIHPWAADFDDEPTMKTPEPAGFYCLGTKEKNRIYRAHVDEALNPFLQRIRSKVAGIVFTLPFAGKGIDFSFNGQSAPGELPLRKHKIHADYFAGFPGRGASTHYNGERFWELPIPITDAIEVHQADVVFYDADGYEKGRDFLRGKGIKHILLCGYTTERCVKNSVFGYDHLSSDFNIFVVGDATLANFPAASTPANATQTALCEISVEHFITQISWIKEF